MATVTPSCGLGCGLLNAPRLSTLQPVLQALIHASAAFPPLQSAITNLLKVIGVAEVRCLSSESCGISLAVLTVFAGQKLAQKSAQGPDIVELKTSFSSLVVKFQGPLYNSASPALRQRKGTFAM